jgi:hypothetical protein
LQATGRYWNSATSSPIRLPGGELPLGDDPLLVPLPGLAGHGLDPRAGRAFQFAGRQVGQPLGQSLEVGHGVDAEDEADAVSIPAVQASGLGEVGVAPVRDLLEPRPSAQGGGLVQVDVGVLVRGPVAAAVDQQQRRGGVGQPDHQRVVAPHPVVRDIDPLLAPAIGRGHRPVGVEEGFLEEVLGRLPPGPQP